MNGTITRPTSGERRSSPAARREQAIDAFIDLVLEGALPPRPEDVAERAAVSLATLYRYFANLDELRHAAMERLLRRFPDLFTIPGIGEGSRRTRITRFVGARITLHETVHPLMMLLRANSIADPGAAALVDAGRQVLADQVRRQFGHELDRLSPAPRDDTVAAVASLTSVESWEYQCRSLGRSNTQIRRTWTDALDRLLPTT